ncbi:hypothetical protein [Chromobacterium haemolyticum]|uniref:hypothetical protein n=1 Tax=Chromobacterium haemolyticum TaxID=394935 RepID=UPI00244892E2|nr:hypothetical protein [Chromobacterium haemolyticum]MDH0342012.1 hypothetical protein [Chromobacterium haemolyticum]
MRMSKRLVFIFLMGPLAAVAAGIFNTDPVPTPAQSTKPATAASAQALPQSVTPQQTTPRTSVPAYHPAVPPPASVIPPTKADPKVMAQFERLPNESDESYIARMKVVYQRSVNDMERASREHIERMKSLAPK